VSIFEQQAKLEKAGELYNFFGRIDVGWYSYILETAQWSTTFLLFQRKEKAKREGWSHLLTAKPSHTSIRG